MCKLLLYTNKFTTESVDERILTSSGESKSNLTQKPHRCRTWTVKERKGKEEFYIALFWPRWHTQSAQAWITQFQLQITPCLPFLPERSPDVTTPATEAAGIQLQLTTHLSTPKG